MKNTLAQKHKNVIPIRTYTNEVSVGGGAAGAAALQTGAGADEDVHLT